MGILINSKANVVAVLAHSKQSPLKVEQVNMAMDMGGSSVPGGGLVSPLLMGAPSPLQAVHSAPSAATPSSSSQVTFSTSAVCKLVKGCLISSFFVPDNLFVKHN